MINTDNKPYNNLDNKSYEFQYRGLSIPLG